MKHHAYTLPEIIIVVLVTSIISLALAVSFSNAKKQAEFKQDQADIVNIIQEARTLSLANIIVEGSVNDFATEYYLLEFTTDGVELTAHATNGFGYDVSSDVSSVSLNSDLGIGLNTTQKVYYVPPYGEVCFAYSSGCDYTSDTDTQKELVLERDGSNQESTITISIYSGYPEVD